VLIVFVLLLPKGLVPTARDLLMRLVPAPKSKSKAQLADAQVLPSAPASHLAGAE
jgi:branched-chain amino acid transport system permease protein